MEIRNAGLKGRGVFALTPLSPGEVVLRESAVCYVGHILPGCSDHSDVEKKIRWAESFKPSNTTPEWLKLYIEHIVSSKSAIETGESHKGVARRLLDHYPMSEIQTWALAPKTPLASPDDVARVVLTNYFGVDLCYHRVHNNKRLPLGHALFRTASLINHSCKPNCTYAVTPKEIIVISIEHIQVGDEITIYYKNALEPQCLCGWCESSCKEDSTTLYMSTAAFMEGDGVAPELDTWLQHSIQDKHSLYLPDVAIIDLFRNCRIHPILVKMWSSQLHNYLNFLLELFPALASTKTKIRALMETI